MIRLRALADHTYDGRVYTLGDTYDAEDPYVEALLALGFAERLDAPTPPPPPPAAEAPPPPENHHAKKRAHR